MLKLLGTRILVTPISAKLISVGGIHLPHQYKSGDNDKLFRVTNIGQGVEEIRVGDAVLVPNWSYRAEVGEGQAIIDQKEVIAVIRED